MTMPRTLLIVALTAAVFLLTAGCGDDTADTATGPDASTATTQATATATVPEEPPPPPGIAVDPALQSATGTPTADEMQTLIAMQAEVPYPIIVPTYIPGGYQLDTTLLSQGTLGESDPVGYYSFRYYNPGQDILNMTFNQSIANGKPLSGYYLTDVEVNGQVYQVYWHKTREYLPAGDPVRTGSVGDAESFVVVWPGQYTAPDGNVYPLYYAITTSTYTGIGWGTMQQIIAGLKPLSAVGG